MKLKAIKELDFKTSNIFIIEDKDKLPSGFSKEIIDFSKTFSKSKDKFDFLKFKSEMYFFVKSSNDLEAMRIHGHSVKSNLSKEIAVLQIIGKTKYQEALAEGLMLSNYQFLKYKKDKTESKLSQLIFYSEDKKLNLVNLTKTIDAVSWTRDLVNEPVSYLTATTLAEEMKQKFAEVKVDVEVYEKSKIEALKMGGLLAVNKGSIDPPTFTILKYKHPKAKNKKPIVLIGKGVVYDTGGLSLKPTAGSMDLMKSDMAGAAGVAGALYNIAAQEIPAYVIALIPATDNRPGLNAYAPGDVITMYDGTTVEVLNTDAEGRMILADALAFSKKYDPMLVVDMATLTGAAVVAIGTKASCMMGNAKQDVIDKLILAGNEVHERVVQLPFWDEYLEQMKSSIADLKNIGGRNAGMITAGKFLEHFVKAPYIHIDIAGPSFLESPENYKGKGGSGVGVRLLTRFVQHLIKA